MNRYRFGTWNAHEGVPSDRSNADHSNRTIAATMSALAELELDVLALQEVDFTSEGSSDLLDLVGRETDLKYSHGLTLSPSAFFSGDDSGVALLSRWPLKNPSSERLRNPKLIARRGEQKVRTFDKGMVTAVVELDGSEVAVASLHAYPFHFFGRDAKDPAFSIIWDELASSLDRMAARTSVVAGDFNTHDRSLILSRLRREMHRTVREAGEARRRQVDDILHSARVLPLGPAVAVRTLSDHDLFYVDAELGVAGDH